MIERPLLLLNDYLTVSNNINWLFNCFPYGQIDIFLASSDRVSFNVFKKEKRREHLHIPEMGSGPQSGILISNPYSRWAVHINVTYSTWFVSQCVLRMRLLLLLNDFLVVSKELNGRGIYLLSCVRLYFLLFSFFFSVFSPFEKISNLEYKYTRFTSCSGCYWFSVLLETLVNNQGSDD